MCSRILAALAVALLFSARADWPMLGHDAARTGATTDEIRPPFERKWYRLFIDEGIQSGVQPVVASGTLFVGTLRGVLHAIDTETGKDIWTLKAGGPILHAAAVHEAMVFFTCADGHVYAANVTDGTLCWKVSAGPALWNAPAAHGGVIYAGGRDGVVHALDAITGRPKWRAQTGGPILSSPALDTKRGRVYVASEDMRLYAFDVRDGREAWRSAELPGASFRGYHPVVAPDGAVMITTQPVLGYDRYQELLLEMTKSVFGDFASWRHKKEENDKLREQNFRQLADPASYKAQLDYLTKKLSREPQFQTFFVFNPETGKQKFVAPIVASESMNGPGAPPLVTPDGKVLVKYQVLLRSRYEHYSPWMNVGWLNTTNGNISPVMDESRTYGWHDSLLLVHDEQSQLTLAGKVLINTHQDNVNAMDLVTLKGYSQPFAWNIHEPATGEALALRMAAHRGEALTPGNEWMIRGTAVYGGGSVIDVPVVVDGDSFYFLPTHELNSGCALIAYRSSKQTGDSKRVVLKPTKLADDEWQQVIESRWDWDTLATPRLKNVLEALPGPVPGTPAAPLMKQAAERVAQIPESELERFINEAGAKQVSSSKADSHQLRQKLQEAVSELLSGGWMPLVIPAAKAPQEAYEYFTDSLQTALTLVMARPHLSEQLMARVDERLRQTIAKPASTHDGPHGAGTSRVAYSVPAKGMSIQRDRALPELSRAYLLHAWSRQTRDSKVVQQLWPSIKSALDASAKPHEDDCGNARLAGLIGYCRIAKTVGDEDAHRRAAGLCIAALRTRVEYELAHTRGGVLKTVPTARQVAARWRNLTPEVGELLRRYAEPVQRELVKTYVDYHRPGWWLAWNVEQLMRNEAPTQLPTTSYEFLSARVLVLDEPQAAVRSYVDIPWCKADEFYIRKLALVLEARETGRN